jgi:protein TonB
LEPEPVQPPEPEIAEPLPEPPPEPVEEVDPLEQQMMAALENVEVPLPMTRPSPPPPPKKEPPKRVVKQQPQASKAATEAKLQVKQSNRTAASRTAEGSAAPSATPARWMSRVRARLMRNARRCPGNDVGTAAIRFSFDTGGNITSVSLSRSSGSPQIDDYLVSAVQRSSPIPAPPAGATRQLTQPITCTR